MTNSRTEDKMEFLSKNPEKLSLERDTYDVVTLENKRNVGISRNIKLHRESVRLGKYLDTGENIVVKIRDLVSHRQEVDILKKLNKLKDIYKYDVNTTYVFEKLEFEGRYDNLETYINTREGSNNPLTVIEKLHLSISIISSIKSLHDLGISHNDLKLDNMIFNFNSFEIELVDFQHGKINSEFSVDLFYINEILSNFFNFEPFIKTNFNISTTSDYNNLISNLNNEIEFQSELNQFDNLEPISILKNKIKLLFSIKNLTLSAFKTDDFEKLFSVLNKLDPNYSKETGIWLEKLKKINELNKEWLELLMKGMSTDEITINRKQINKEIIELISNKLSIEMNALHQGLSLAKQKKLTLF
ncbi:MAG: hypothetical protein KIT56_00795 [Gammaproteobacteria bacterium]|nr:hypothetical protein [Gammaproteobacteria bacterium]MCW5582423.1 hypothetical protein [Gammaproteobacteria bacterium]